jgi:tetratricopeptide (TPR) repeat protein
VRRGLLLGIGASVAVSAWLAVRPARADWEVRRSDNRAAVEQAARALAARPEDTALAARLVRLAGKAGAPPLRARFEAAARGAEAPYAAVAAYATLLSALGADDDAAAAFARAAALAPGAAMLAGRARALARAGRRDEAAAAYEEALTRARTPAERRRLLEAEVVLVPPADLERELAIRRALAALEPASEEAALRVVDVLERLGRPTEAADTLEARGALDHPGAFERALRVAELRDAGGDSARAADVLAALLTRLPRADTDRRRLAWARALVVARHRDALPALAAALAREPGSVEWDVLGQVRGELGDLEGALAAERRAAGAHLDAELGRRIVALCDKLGREDEAVAVYEELARRAPDDPSWALELVERELRRGRRRQGEAHFDHAAARFAASPSAMVRLAELASRWDEHERALAAWERVRRLAPRDEQGILGLGETQFAAGKRELALKTWRALRERSPGLPGRLRLAEVLLEHDLGVEALAEAQEARARAPKDASVHRLLAQILERQRQTDAALREWEESLALAAGPAEASFRREARARILVLLTRVGRARLDERVRALEERVRAAPDDRETAIFLAEAQQRLGNLGGAIATLRAVADRGGAGPDADAEATLALVRLLRANGRTEEAVSRLEDLARRVPARAREAHVQLADVELARHDEAVALAHAEAAARLGAGDGQALARIAAIEERAGDEARAAETYRRAFDGDADATAGLALASLLERRGDVSAAADVLRHIVETATDDEVIVEAGRRALDAEEVLGRLPDFERLVARGLFAGGRAPALGRVLVDVLRRLLPALYRAPATDAAAREARARIAQHGLRPLLEQLGDGEAAPDPALVELLGLLGNRDAAPALARLAAPATDAPATGERAARPSGADEARLAAVIALGRLGDERAHDVLEKLAGAPDGRLRAAAVWALGRLGDPRDVALFTRALRDARADVVGFACLGLGRARGARAAEVLASVARDVARPASVRLAAAAGLGASTERAATATLLALARSGDDTLGRAALLALGARRDRRALPALLEAALLDRPARAGAALLALDAWASGAPSPDEALAIDGARLDLDALVASLEPLPAGADTTVLWRDDPRLVAGPLLDALADRTSPERRRQALGVLDAPADGASLAPLLAAGAPPLPAALAMAVDAAVREAVASHLDEADAGVRAAALRALARMGDSRVTARRVAEAAAGRPDERAAALAVARRWATTAPRDARALADVLAAALAASSVPRAPEGDATEPTSRWEARLGLVDALAALGGLGASGLERALGDANAVVRGAAAEALGRVGHAWP